MSWTSVFTQAAALGSEDFSSLLNSLLGLAASRGVSVSGALPRPSSPPARAVGGPKKGKKSPGGPAKPATPPKRVNNPLSVSGGKEAEPPTIPPAAPSLKSGKATSPKPRPTLSEGAEGSSSARRNAKRVRVESPVKGTLSPKPVDRVLAQLQSRLGQVQAVWSKWENLPLDKRGVCGQSREEALHIVAGLSQRIVEVWGGSSLPKCPTDMQSALSVLLATAKPENILRALEAYEVRIAELARLSAKGDEGGAMAE